MTDHIPLVLFDGVCNLCNATVVFLLRWEAQPVLKFANLQSDFGKKVLERYSLSSEAMDTIAAPTKSSDIKCWNLIFMMDGA